MSTLFPNSEARTPDAPYQRLRGRGANPLRQRTFVAKQANLAGRYELTFSYRPLKAWTDDTLAVAEALIERYFAVGGFRTADFRLMRIVIDALRSYSRQEIEWAIDAKLTWQRAPTLKERNQRSTYRGSVETFFSTRLSYWLDQSSARQRHEASARDAAGRSAEQAAREQRIAREREHAATPEQTRTVCAEVLSHRKSMQEILAEEDAHWARLTGEQQHKALDAAVQQMAAILGGRVGEHHRDQVARSARSIAMRMFPCAMGVPPVSSPAPCSLAPLSPCSPAASPLEGASK